MPMAPVRGGEVQSLHARLAAQVRARRAEVGWRQCDLAKEAGVCRHTVMRLEAGEGGTVAVIDAICRALGLSFGLGVTLRV